MLSSVRRRELGAFYTPDDVAARLVDIALEGTHEAVTVCDPACGDGAFLMAAARALETRGVPRAVVARDLLWGVDIDADAVAAARDAITSWSGVPPGDHVTVGDGLGDLGWTERFDVVVGNPPFLNQLERATARDGATRWSSAAGPYADTAFLFLLAALDLVRVGGRVVLVQPQSLVAARDARGVRDALMAASALSGMWTCNELIFDANARVCAPVITRGGSQPASVARWSGRDVAPIAATRWQPSPTWSRYLVRPDAAPLATVEAAGTLGQIATATAGFRQQFYGLAPFVVDRCDADDREFPRLVTCGVIDAAHCAWGERPLRFAGQRWEYPRLDRNAMADGPLSRWVDDRLVPKVVLATQTKVLEATVDVDGTWVPSTPVIAVHADPAALFRVAAVLLSPTVSAWAATTFAGAALTSDAIKLSARQVLDIPLPADDASWGRGAVAVEGGDLLTAGRWMTKAYGSDDHVYDWWARRLPQ